MYPIHIPGTLTDRPVLRVCSRNYEGGGDEFVKQFVTIADRGVVIFKLLEPPSMKDFKMLVGQTRKVAKQTGMTRANIANSIMKARRAQ